MTEDVEATLEQAKSEIIALRRRNEILEAKVQVLDLIAGIRFAQQPSPPQGWGIDAVFSIERTLREQRAAADRKKAEEPKASRPGDPLAGHDTIGMRIGQVEDVRKVPR